VLVLVAPRLIDGRVIRVVNLPDGGARLERWAGSAWAPGGAAFAEVFFAPPASDELLDELGVPPEDWE
jgi:hypothetical protein